MLSDDAVSIDYTISTLAQTQSVDLSQGPAAINLSLSNQSSDITIIFTVTDATGNSASFNTIFCTSCLLEVASENLENDQTQDDESIVTDDLDADTSMDVNVLIGLCIVLVFALIIMIVRSPQSRKAPSGLPTKSEDEWISKYTNKK